MMSITPKIEKTVDEDEIDDVKKYDDVKLEIEESGDITEIDNFEEMVGEHHDGMLLRGIFGYGFEKPSAIQGKTIMPVLSGRDVIAQAQSGSGKTGAFGIASIARVDMEIDGPQVIIIENTKELALQVKDVVDNIGKYVKIKTCLCIGQNNKTYENIEEARKSHILIGTPGRLLDLFTKSPKLATTISLLVLDEADELLKSKGKSNFIETIYGIITKMPKKSQICCFSATYTDAIVGEDGIINCFMKDPQKILIKNSEVSVKMIKNYFCNICTERGKYYPEQIKYNKLVEFYSKLNLCQTIIFVNTTNTVVQLTEKLKSDKYSVDMIHGTMNDLEKREVLKQFRRSTFRILITTDLIARGIDVQQVGLVINFDVPQNPEYYIHRVGRSGRYGRIGIAITFVIDDNIDTTNMRKIEDVYEIEFEEMPDLKDVNSMLIGMATI